MAKKKKQSAEEQATVEREELLDKFQVKYQDKNVRDRLKAIVWLVEYMQTGVDPDEIEEEEGEEGTE
jgi:hypothetical protein